MIFSVLSFILPLSVYLYTLCPGIPVYADAGEFPTQAFVSGFAHPPGYPLFILLIRLFQILPFGNPAQNANLVSALFSAAGIYLFFIISHRLTGKIISSFAAALTLAFSLAYWRNAVVSEVFGVLAFFILLCFWLYLKWHDTKTIKYFYFFILACGFGLAHHQLLVITLFPLLLHILLAGSCPKFKPRQYLFSLILILAGFSPYLYIWWSASGWPLLNWENPSNPAGLFRLITRAGYGTFILTPSAQPVEFVSQFRGIFGLLAESFLAAFPLFFIGLYNFMRRNFFIFAYSLLVIFSVFALSLYSGMPVNQPVQIQYLERFQVISSVFIALIMSYAMARLGKYSVLALLFPVFLLIINFSLASQRGDRFAEQITRDVYAAVPDHSILILNDDAMINNLFYFRYVLGQKPSVALLIAGLLDAKPDWYLQEIHRFYPDLVIPDASLPSPDFYLEFIKLNQSRREIYHLASGFAEEHHINLPEIQKGLVLQYVNPDQIPSPASQEAQLQPYLGNPSGNTPRTSAEKALMPVYARPDIYLARLFRDADFSQSEKYYLQALAITPDDYTVFIELGDLYLAYGDPSKAVSAWRRALPLLNNQDLRTRTWDKILRHTP